MQQLVVLLVVVLVLVLVPAVLMLVVVDDLQKDTLLLVLLVAALLVNLVFGTMSDLESLSVASLELGLCIRKIFNDNGWIMRGISPGLPFTASNKSDRGQVITILDTKITHFLRSMKGVLTSCTTALQS